ncbi:MAG: molybdopterin-binding protein [Bacillota bacterium]|nr:molybdopterin-binding protein [Bacillota bacterium]
MIKVRTTEAVGMILCHDITRIVPGEFKGRAFKKGHQIKEEDVEELLKLGKEHIFAWEQQDGVIHENDAAERIAKAIIGDNLSLTEPNQGKISLIAKISGLLKVNIDLLTQANSIDQIAIATLHNNRIVKTGDIVAGTRVIPLVIDEAKIETVEKLCHNNSSLLQVLPMKKLQVGMVTTGNEVFSGRIKDAFGPAVRKKLEQYDCSLLKQVFTPDDQKIITDEIIKLIEEGAELVVVTGGMSVDPDDNTPAAVKATGAEIITYGTPVLPGSMLLLAYYGKVPIVGLPGCVMYAKTTVFDLILPRILAEELLTKRDIALLGHGGLCLECPECVFPHCFFGKGR